MIWWACRGYGTVVIGIFVLILVLLPYLLYCCYCSSVTITSTFTILLVLILLGTLLAAFLYPRDGNSAAGISGSQPLADHEWKRNSALPDPAEGLEDYAV